MVSDRLKTIVTWGGISFLGVATTGLFFMDVESDRKLREERTQYFYEALLQGDIVSQYDKNNNGKLEREEMRSLLDAYQLSPRE